MPHLRSNQDQELNVEAERQLLQEILMDAIECWQAALPFHSMGDEYATGLRERLHREANFWIFGEYRNAPFFSFTQVCECLGLDPEFVRRRLLEWKRKHSPQR